MRDGSYFGTERSREHDRKVTKSANSNYADSCPEANMAANEGRIHCQAGTEHGGRESRREVGGDREDESIRIQVNTILNVSGR